MDIRRRWESMLYDMTAFDFSEDGTFNKTYYIYRSPIGMGHREFELIQVVWKDFPEPGMFTVYMRSVDEKDSKFATNPGNVRATCHIMTLVVKPQKYPNGEDYVSCMFCTNIDINGLVPKWIVNIAARSAPG